jgi:hypothetical protein
MIDITEQLLKIARTIDDFEGRCYSYYPQTMKVGKPLLVLTCTGHDPYYSSDGEEVVTNLTYTVDAYGPSPSVTRDLLGRLSAKYSPLHLRLVGNASDYDSIYQMYHTQATYSVIVDKRGITYTE